jgi:hypothetical protein
VGQDYDGWGGNVGGGGTVAPGGAGPGRRKGNKIDLIGIDGLEGVFGPRNELKRMLLSFKQCQGFRNEHLPYLLEFLIRQKGI